MLIQTANKNRYIVARSLEHRRVDQLLRCFVHVTVRPQLPPNTIATHNKNNSMIKDDHDDDDDEEPLKTR